VCLGSRRSGRCGPWSLLSEHNCPRLRERRHNYSIRHCRTTRKSGSASKGDSKSRSGMDRNPIHIPGRRTGYSSIPRIRNHPIRHTPASRRNRNCTRSMGRNRTDPSNTKLIHTKGHKSYRSSERNRKDGDCTSRTRCRPLPRRSHLRNSDERGYRPHRRNRQRPGPGRRAGSP